MYLYRSLRRPRWLRLSLDLQWVFGPGMFWVTAAQLLAHLLISVLPEAGQVIGNLLATIVRCKQMEQQPHFALRDARRIGHSKKILDARCQHGWLVGFIAQQHGTTIWQDIALRRFAGQHPALWRSKQLLDQ